MFILTPVKEFALAAGPGEAIVCAHRVLIVLRSTLCGLGLNFDCSSGWEVKRTITVGMHPQSLCPR